MNTPAAPDQAQPLHSQDIAVFINNISLLVSESNASPICLSTILTTWLGWEQSLKTLCKESRRWNATLSLPNNYTGLIDLFHPNTPACLRVTPRLEVQNVLKFPVIMSLPPGSRRAPGSATTVNSMEEFELNWEVFSNGCFSSLRSNEDIWKGMVIAGGAVEACLSALPDYAKVSLETRRRYFEEKYASSDIDVFFYGLDFDEMHERIRLVCATIAAATSQQLILKRTKHTLTMKLFRPYRKIQFILHRSSFPAEILANFDLDAPCCLYDGTKVYSSPRSIVAMMRQANVIDYRRDRGDFELRFVKYYFRGYELYLGSHPERLINPTTSIILHDLAIAGFRKNVLYPCKGLALLMTIAKQFQVCQSIEEQKELLDRYWEVMVSSEYDYTPTASEPKRHELVLS